MYIKEERDLLELIKRNDVRGVVFLTGDPHHAGVYKLGGVLRCVCV